MAMDVALDVLTDPDFLIDITIERKAQGSYTDGLYVAGAAASFVISGSVQPAQAEDFINREEGERFGGSQVIYSLTELIGSKDLTVADEVKNYLGVDWKVTQVQPWSHHGFYKSIITKVDNG